MSVMPYVTRAILDKVKQQPLDINSQKVKTNVFTQWMCDVDEDNPVIAHFIKDVSDKLEIVTQAGIDPAWYIMSAMLIMYKSLETALNMRVAESN